MKMNIKLKSIKKGLLLALASVVTTVIVASPVAAIPYQGANTPALPSPAFNQYTGVPSQGDESDFFRGRESGNGAFTNNVSSACNNGQEFSLQAYVHNGADQTQNNNGSGPSVAHGTKIRVALPGNSTAASFPINAQLTSSNAGGMSDGLTINCGSKTVKLSYVAGSAVQVNTLSGTQALSDSIVTTGASIGTMSPNGDVWGCWDQRVFVYLKVKVEVVPETPQSLGECKMVDLQAEADRKVTVNVTGSVTNATIVGYKIDFGDGTTSDKQSDSHQYAKDGTYTITTSVQIRFADGHTEWKTATSCMKVVTFESGKPPEITVTPPTSTTVTSLPNTGPGAVLAIFAGVTGLSTLAYSVLARRFS